MRSRFALLALGLLFARTAQAQLPDLRTRFEKRVAMIPARDGVRLNTEIYTPTDRPGPFPFILLRTPYGLPHDKNGYLIDLHTILKELADEGYIFAMQDIRGKYGSEGVFVMNRPPRERSDPKGIDEATDAYDTVEWLVKNVPNNNGRAGMVGISYLGWTTIMAGMDPHPALKAISPQASPDDMWMGDDFHHNGAFRLSYGFEYVAELESGKENRLFDFDRYDTYEWYLQLGPLSKVEPTYAKGRWPTWTDYVKHPDFDQYWQRRKVSPYLTTVKVPTLSVAGWWDQEDFYGPVTIYEALEQHDPKGINYLVVGPWNHGGWAESDGAGLGRIRFGSPTSVYFREKVQAPWFAYWLKDRGKLDLPEALTFRAGCNTWERHGAWPPKAGGAVETRRLYFQPNGGLSFTPPTSSDPAFDSYVSDPAHPVPYRVRPIRPTYAEGSTWDVWLTDDQRHAHLRPDVLSWETAPLEADVTLSGQITARLFASTTRSDADWIVKLIDVYPEKYPPDPALGGYQLMVANDVFRGRYHRSFSRPVALVPGQVTPFAIDLHTQDYCFKPGHKIMVQVQSTWFPLIDRNPQRFVPNIFAAQASDFQVATHRIHRSARYPSHVELQVAK